MESIALGTTGRTVARMGLGAMPLSLDGRPDRASAKAVVRRAVELGVTFIDTADAYCLDHTETGHNERLVAEALREMGLKAGGGGPGDPVVATKGGRTRRGGRWGIDGRPEHLRAACEASLAALSVERIDLYQLHIPDPSVPFLESVGALARLREEGKVGAVGLSNVSPAEVLQAMTVTPITSVQNRLGPWDAGSRPSPIVELCQTERITFIAHSPLGGGHRVGDVARSIELQALGRELGASPHELVLAWLMRHSPAILPIPGASRIASVDSSVRAADLGLSPASAGAIEGAFRSLPGAESILRRVRGKVKTLLGKKPRPEPL